MAEYVTNGSTIAATTNGSEVDTAHFVGGLGNRYYLYNPSDSEYLFATYGNTLPNDPSPDNYIVVEPGVFSDLGKIPKKGMDNDIYIKLVSDGSNLLWEAAQGIAPTGEGSGGGGGGGSGQKGDKGDKGEDGADGKDGLPGKDGDPGADGKDGNDLTWPLPALNGSPLAPSYSFKNDGASGMYRVGSKVVGFAIDGVERMRVKGDGVKVTGDLWVNEVTTRHVDSGQNSNLELKHNGDTRVYVGGTVVAFNAKVKLQQEGTDADHVVTKGYVDGLTDSISSHALFGDASNDATDAFRLRSGDKTFVSLFGDELGLYHVKAPTSPTHVARLQDVTDADYAPTSHSHSYAASGHTHDSYAIKGSSKKIMQDDGSTGPVQFTVSGNNLYWSK